MTVCSVSVPRAVVTIEYSDLLDGSIDISDLVKAGFGRDGLGVIAVRDIPGWKTLIETTIPLAHGLISLPENVLQSLEHQESLFNSGWSFGKEKLGDKPDMKKASFYFNPLSDDPRPETRATHPWALPANRWPTKELPEFEDSCKKLGSVMHGVVVALAKRIDAMELGTKIAEEMKTSLKAKGRMLYYYPLKGDDLLEAQARPDGWIGWHNDSGFLTALTPDMYFKHSTGERVPNPEPETAGLWVASRNGELHRVNIPEDCMAIQCGECLQIITGGELVATPHCVRPPLHTLDVSRACMPVFVDSSPEFPLVSPSGHEAVFVNTVKQRVPPLNERWTEGQTFADFLGTTFKAYYEWSVSK
jgi:isopenicillin N synthase-like dioxygenase